MKCVIIGLAIAAIFLLVLLAVVALSLYVARSVAQPLARLTSSADRVARIAEAELVRVADDESERPDPVRLDPVEVSATDEIGDLARAQALLDRSQKIAPAFALSRSRAQNRFTAVGRVAARAARSSSSLASMSAVDPPRAMAMAPRP